MKTIKKITENLSFSLFNNYETIRKIKNKINEVIDAVNSIPAPVPPEKELPEVSAGDDGDILTVVSGAWAKSSPVSEIFLVTFDEVDGNLTCDKTYSEITTALSNGKTVIAKLTQFSEGYGLITYNSGDLYQFSAYVYTAEDGLIACYANIDNTNAVSQITGTITFTPDE